MPKRKARPHPGAHRLLHPAPTRHHEVRALSCQACGTDVSGVAQSLCEVYDWVEIPVIVPDVNRVSLQGSTCPCCARRFKAAAPAGLEPGSPFGLITSAEARRNATLREVQRHRDVLTARLARAGEAIVEAEFTDFTHTSAAAGSDAGRAPPGGNRS